MPRVSSPDPLAVVNRLAGIGRRSRCAGGKREPPKRLMSRVTGFLRLKVGSGVFCGELSVNFSSPGGRAHRLPLLVREERINTSAAGRN